MFELILLFGSYLLGSLPFGLTLGKIIYGRDVRDFGSGNVGATNVWRTFGWKLGLTAFVLDLAKGLVPVLAARHWFLHSSWLIVGSGFVAIVGHNASPFLKFKGGKGVATSLGVAFGLSWKAATIGFAAWFALLGVTGYISLSSVLSTPLSAFLIWSFNDYSLPFGLFGLICTISVVVTHKSNFSRIIAGTEPKVRKKPAAPATTPNDSDHTTHE